MQEMVFERNESERSRRYLSRTQAAEYLGILERLLDEWIAARRFPAVRAGRRVLLDRIDLDRYYGSLKAIA